MIENSVSHHLAASLAIVTFSALAIGNPAMPAMSAMGAKETPSACNSWAHLGPRFETVEKIYSTSQRGLIALISKLPWWTRLREPLCKTYFNRVRNCLVENFSNTPAVAR